jgi:hypothetical protein
MARSITSFSGPVPPEPENWSDYEEPEIPDANRQVGHTGEG